MQEVNNSYLLEVIYKACSQDPVSVKDAERKIQELEIQPGFCINLLVIHMFSYPY